MTGTTGTVYAIVMVNGDRFAWVGDVNAPDTVSICAASFLVLEGGTLVNTAQIVSMTPAE